MTAKKKRVIIIALIICAALLTIIFYSPIVAFLKQNGILRAEQTGNYLAVLDVGEADAILVQSDGKTALIDTGDITDAGNALAVKLKQAGILTIDTLILTHSHTDHAGGLYEILSQFEVKKFYYTTIFSENETAKEYFSQVRKIMRQKQIDAEIIKEDQAFCVGAFDFEVLACDIKSTDGDEINNAGVVLKAECDGRSFLLMADAEEYTERYLIGKYENLQCDVLKIGHHGSNTSSSRAFIKSVLPKYAAISCGDKETYGHPSDEVLQRLNKYGARVLRTDIHSDIYFYVNNGRLAVTTAK
ncbi:MAG: MBL fold metallo-hydrolase [Clostridia bacterium]|nr:MBL fold metallo-hydrolase [Clostridia bacterium]